MFQAFRGPLTVLGRLLLCTIFFMAAWPAGCVLPATTHPGGPTLPIAT